MSEKPSESALHVYRLNGDPRKPSDVEEVAGSADTAYPFAQETEAERHRQAEREAVMKGIGELDDDQNAAVLRKELQIRRRLLTPMPLVFVTQTAKKYLHQRKLSNELFFYIPFLVLFIIVFVADRDIEGAYWAGYSLGGQTGGGEVPTLEATRPLRPGEVESHHISKTLFEVKTVDEWHHWFETMIIDFFFRDPDPNTFTETNNWMAGFNLKVGSIRVRTLRMNNNTCNPSDTIPNASTVACYGPFSMWGVNTSDHGQFPYHECPSKERLTQGLVHLYPCHGNVFEIPWNLTQSQARARARQMYSLYSGQADILDPAVVRFIAVEFIAYTPSIDEFIMVKGFTEVTPGGKFTSTVRADAFQVWSRSSIWYSILWIIVYVAVFLFVGLWVVDFRRAIQNGEGLEYFLSVWNALELLNLLAFLSIFVVRIMWIQESDSIKFKLPSSYSYPEQLEYVEWLFRFYVYASSFNIVITCIKVLKYVALNPQLNVVTRTLESSGQNLVGILVIFVVVLTAYSLAATSLYSNAIEDYRDFATAFSTLLRILLGDFDYDALREENRYVTGVFFWSYVILALFMLLNFFIGVIASSFQKEVEATKAPPLHESIGLALKSVEEGIKEFFSSPKKWISTAIETRRSKFAEFGRLTTLHRVLKTYRTLKVDVTEEEWELLDDVEREAVLPNPTITFFDLKTELFPAVYTEDGTERYDWIGEKYLTSLWLDIYREFIALDADSEATEAEELQMHIQLATEESLRFVLGLSLSTEHKATKEMLQVQDLFAPKATTMKRVVSMSSSVAKLEGHIASVLNEVAKLDAKLGPSEVRPKTNKKNQ